MPLPIIAASFFKLIVPVFASVFLANALFGESWFFFECLNVGMFEGLCPFECWNVFGNKVFVSWVFRRGKKEKG